MLVLTLNVPILILNVFHNLIKHLHVSVQFVMKHMHQFVEIMVYHMQVCVISIKHLAKVKQR